MVNALIGALMIASVNAGAVTLEESQMQTAICRKVGEIGRQSYQFKKRGMADAPVPQALLSTQYEPVVAMAKDYGYSEAISPINAYMVGFKRCLDMLTGAAMYTAEAMAEGDGSAQVHLSSGKLKLPTNLNKEASHVRTNKVVRKFLRNGDFLLHAGTGRSGRRSGGRK